MKNPPTHISGTDKALLELRLQRWAEAELREAGGGGGYPHRASIARMGGAGGSRNPGDFAPTGELDALELARAIQQLDHQFQMVIRAKFVWTGLMVTRYQALHISQQRFSDLYNKSILLLHLELNRK